MIDKVQWAHLKAVDEPPPKRTMQQLAQEAIDIQNGCNPRGLIHSFAKATQELSDILAHPATNNNQPEFSCTELRFHPVIQLWVSKLHDLANMGLSDMDAYGKAYDECKKLAGI